MCKQGFVPFFYGYINQVDPSAFQPALQHFVNDYFPPNAILLEYLPNAESLNCKNYSDARYQHAVDGMKQVHNAHVHHQDIYPKNLLLVPGTPERVVWVDFDVATTFSSVGPDEERYSQYEDILVAEFGEFLVCSPLICYERRLTSVLSSERIKGRDSRQTRNSTSALVR